MIQKLLSLILYSFYLAVIFTSRYICYGYANPAQVICLSGLMYHRSMPWLIACLLVGALNFFFGSLLEVKASIQSMEELLRDFLAGEWRFRKEDSAKYVKSDDFKIRASTRAQMRRMFGDASGSHLEVFMKEEPLYIYIATQPGGRILGAAKAFPNFRGPSIVIVAKPIERMRPMEKFVLYHEIQHVSEDGLIQFNMLHSRPPYLLINSLLFLTLLSHWPVMPATFVVALGLLYYIRRNRQETSINMRGMRELLADNWALNHLATENRSEVISVIKLLKGLFEDQLSMQKYDTVPQDPATFHKYRMKSAELSIRLGQVKQFEDRLLHNQAPLRFYSMLTTPPLNLICCSALFIYLGIASVAPSALTMVPILGGIVWSIVMRYSNTGKMETLHHEILARLEKFDISPTC